MCNQIKMRSYWIRVGPKFKITVVFIGRGNLNTETQAHRKMSFEHGDRNWNYASSNQITAKIASHHQRL